MFVLSKQPQGFHLVIRDAIKLFFASFLRAMPLCMLGVIVAMIPMVVMWFQVETDNDSEKSSAVLLVSLVIILLCPVVFSCVLYQVQGIAEAQKIGFGEAFRRAVKSIVPVLAGSVLSATFVAIGTMLFIIPGILVFVSLSCWWMGVVLDKKTAISALKDSQQLVYGNWWRTAIILSSVYGFLAAIGRFVELLDEIPESYLQSWPGQAGMICLVILNAVAIPILFCSVMVVLYNDLKLRAAQADVQKNSTA